MNIVKNINQYQDDCVYFCEPIKNNVMPDGNFIRILYSNSLFVLNGINLLISLYDISTEKYYNKYKCSFNVSTHKDLIENLRLLEEKILKRCNIKIKIPKYKISEQMRNGNIKLFIEDTDKLISGKFMLKISGIWETENQYGLTYKFVKAETPFQYDT